ncbi:MAG: hypothetical protein IJW23_13825 [Lentisphaeria bacterium]|nr:hypothetical protein [Lentisphaeria bacterium]
MKKIYLIPAAAFLAIFFSSCSMFDDVVVEKDLKEDKAEDRFAFLRDKNAPKPKPMTDTEKDEVAYPGEKPDGKQGNTLAGLNTPRGTGKEEPPKSQEAPRFFDDLIVTNGEEELTASLVFNSAPLVDVIPAFADILGFNFVVDSNLKSTVTVNLNSKMTRRELWNTFDRMLFIAGAGATVEDSLLRITPLAQLARQPGGNGEIFFYAFKNSTAKEVVAQIKPFLGVNSVCVELARPNAILICDEQSNMPKIKALLTTIDQNCRRNWPRLAVKCNYVLPSKLVEELQNVLPTLGFTVTKTNERNAPPGSVQMTGVDRVGLLVISAANQEALDEIRKWIAIFDSSESIDQERVFVYKVTHGKADQLAQALSVVYNTTGSSLTIDTSTGNSRTTQINTANRTRTTTTGGTNRNNQTSASASIFDNNVRVFADGRLNRLVIRTTPRTYASIQALLKRLDVVPPQVLLQVLVVEVTLTESTQFGIEFSAAGSINGNKTLLGTNYSELSNIFSTDANGNTTMNTGSNRQNGFTFAIANPDNPQEKFGYIRALAGNGDVKVISSPQLLVTSHKEAVFQVGDRVPYISQGTTDTSSNGTMLQNYDYEDTGVILTVTPQITSTGLICMNVKQELSSVVRTTSSGLDSPTFSKRVIETEMTIANGRTMILGGLIQERRTDSLDTIPVINQIPFLRRLFGNTNANVERTEILVLITGYVITEKSPVEEMMGRYNDSIRLLNQFNRDIEERSKPSNKKRRLLKTGEFWR